MTYVRKTKYDRYKKILIFAVGTGIIIIILVLAILPKLEFPYANKKGDDIIKNKQMSQVNVLRANREVEAGETADAVKFEIVSVPKELVPEGAVTNIHLLKDKRVIENLAKNEFLLHRDLIEGNAWYEEGDRLVEHTFQNGAIPATVDKGSVVDIKLFVQKAEDTVVVSKAVVVGKAENTLSFYLNSREQEYLKEANVEGMLFLVQYVDKTQQASDATYIPSYEKNQS